MGAGVISFSFERFVEGLLPAAAVQQGDPLRLRWLLDGGGLQPGGAHALRDARTQIQRTKRGLPKLEGWSQVSAQYMFFWKAGFPGFCGFD